MTWFAWQKEEQLTQALELTIPVLNLHLTLRAMPKDKDIRDLKKLHYMIQNTP